MKVLGLFSGSSGCGTTMTGLSLALEFTERGYKAIFIYGSGKSCTSFIDSQMVHSIESIRAAILSGSLSVADLEEVIDRKGNLHIIGSVKSTWNSRAFPINTFEMITRVLKEEGYDIVVIDGGDRMELAMTVSAINVSTLRYFVITQDKKALDRFQDMDEHVLKPLELDCFLILNRYERDISLYGYNEIEQITGKVIKGAIPLVQGGRQAEINGTTLRTKGRYRKAVKRIADGIEDEWKL